MRTRTYQKTNSIIHLGNLIDFHETGALCKAIDAVVSVDTSIVHLAGAIGQSVVTIQCGR